MGETVDVGTMEARDVEALAERLVEFVKPYQEVVGWTLTVGTVYLPGLDIVRERCRAQRCDPFQVLEQVRRHAAAVDRELSAWWQAHRERALLFVVGLPGRAGAGERGVLVAHWPAEDRRLPAEAPAEAPLLAVAPTWIRGGFHG